MKNKNYSSIFRIVHWAIAICMFLILITIFLRLTWMNKDHVAGIVQNYLTSVNLSLSQDQAIVLAKEIRKPMWNWHIYLGYVLTGLFCLRLTLHFLSRMRFSNPLEKLLSSKEKFQYWVYMVFYVCAAISLITGLIIELGPKSFKSTTEGIHVLSIYYLLAFIIIHLGGVILAEFTDQQGIVSRILSGSRKTKEITSTFA